MIGAGALFLMPDLSTFPKTASHSQFLDRQSLALTHPDSDAKMPSIDNNSHNRFIAVVHGIGQLTIHFPA